MQYSITSLLNKSGSSSAKDQKSFRKWELFEISTDECIEEFLENNKQPQGLYVDPVEFERWLNSLGYIRGVE